jgi:hypothetical protein
VKAVPAFLMPGIGFLGTNFRGRRGFECAVSLSPALALALALLPGTLAVSRHGTVFLQLNQFFCTSTNNIHIGAQPGKLTTDAVDPIDQTRSSLPSSPLSVYYMTW